MFFVDGAPPINVPGPTTPVVSPFTLVPKSKAKPLPLPFPHEREIMGPLAVRHYELLGGLLPPNTPKTK